MSLKKWLKILLIKFLKEGEKIVVVVKRKENSLKDYKSYLVLLIWTKFNYIILLRIE